MRLIDGDYLYNKLVANKCPYDLVLQMVKDEPTVDVLEQIRAEIDGIEINGQIDEHTMFIRTGEQVKQMALNIIDHYTK